MITAALDEAARGADLLHLHSNGLIVEVAAAWAHATPHAVRADALRHRDLALPPSLADRSVHARVSRRTAVTFYSRKLLERAQELGLDREGLTVVYPTVGAGIHAARCGRARA